MSMSRSFSEGANPKGLSEAAPSLPSEPPFAAGGGAAAVAIAAPCCTGNGADASGAGCPPPPRRSSSPARSSLTNLGEYTCRSPHIFAVLRTFSTRPRSRSQTYRRLWPRTAAKASRNLGPLFRLLVCRTSLATYSRGSSWSGRAACRADLHSLTACAAPRSYCRTMAAAAFWMAGPVGPARDSAVRRSLVDMDGTI